MAWTGIINRYRAWMEIPAGAVAVTLHEGNTPLIPAPKLAAWVGGHLQLFLKYEGLNPTGSFKDRGMTAAITVAKHEGATSVICASTGNTSASAAAYAARAGMTCFVLIPGGKVALGKLAAALAYGAKLVSIEGSFDQGLDLVREVAQKSPIALVNSVNPARLEGQKTAAWEICEQLGATPDVLSLPVGNAGNISAYWMGFSACWCHKCPSFCANKGPQPRLIGTQAAGSAPLLLGHPVEFPETKATAIRIGKPARGQQALDAISESKGKLFAATDDEIFDAYRHVASLEGIFCEPSSAASLAGLKRAVLEAPHEFEGKKVVCILTGNGLKDPDSVFESSPQIAHVQPTYDSIMKELFR